MATCRIENDSTDHKVIYCCSVYMDYHNKDVINTKLKHLTKFCVQNDHELLVLSDCNRLVIAVEHAPNKLQGQENGALHNGNRTPGPKQGI